MMKILLIEDDKRITTAMGIRIKSFGFNFSSSPDAISAVSEAVRYKPDLVILDINLPGGDGFTVAERLQCQPEFNQTPIVFITASKKDGLKNKARAVGAVGYLEKPFDSMQLLQAIQDSVDPDTASSDHHAW